MSIQNPHDRFFRDSFGRPEIARNYMEEYLPADLRALLDLDNLTLQDGSFIDETMQEHQTDLLYKINLHNGESAFIYFLFEHKSYPDPMVALQLLRYMVRFWERQAKEKEPLSPIIPLVIYHGEKVWNTPTQFLAVMDVPDELRPFLPNFHYHLTDFSWMSDETIRGEIWLQVATAVLRAIFNPQLPNELDNLFELIFQLDQQRTGLEYIRTILYYLSKATEKVDRETLTQALLRQGKKGEAVMATIAQEYIQEGYEKGIEYGIERGMERGGLEMQKNIARHMLTMHDIQTVSESTGLSIDEVSALRDQQN